MPISVQWPVPHPQFPITGEYLQTDDAWTPDHPHLGVDFDCPRGTRVVSATVQGKVDGIFDWTNFGDGSFGRCVRVDVLGTPYWYLYAHLSETGVVLNQYVNPGDLIGLSGDTGKNGPGTYAPHLHVQASILASFPRENYLVVTGDPILGLRAATPAPPPSMDLTELTTLVIAQGESIATLSERIIANEAAMAARDQKILAAIAALTEALKK